MKSMIRITLFAALLIGFAFQQAEALFVADTNPGGDKLFLDQSSNLATASGNVGDQNSGPAVSIVANTPVDTGSGYSNIKPSSAS